MKLMFKLVMFADDSNLICSATDIKQQVSTVKKLKIQEYCKKTYFNVEVFDMTFKLSVKIDIDYAF